MIRAYVNYPNPHVTIHANPSCAQIQKQSKSNQRVVKLNVATVTRELQNLAAGHYKFAANQSFNDMWLEVDFGDAAFEKAVVNYVAVLLGNHNTSFSKLVPEEHDCN